MTVASACDWTNLSTRSLGHRLKDVKSCSISPNRLLGLTFLDGLINVLGHCLRVRDRDATKANIYQRFAVVSSLLHESEERLRRRPSKVGIVQEPATWNEHLHLDSPKSAY